MEQKLHFLQVEPKDGKMFTKQNVRKTNAKTVWIETIFDISLHITYHHLSPRTTIFVDLIIYEHSILGSSSSFGYLYSAAFWQNLLE